MTPDLKLENQHLKLKLEEYSQKLVFADQTARINKRHMKVMQKQLDLLTSNIVTYTKLNAELAASLTNKDILKVYDDEEEE